jgi:hypothetical protein
MNAMETDATKIDLGQFDFTPDWAKKDAGVVVGRTSAGREGGDARQRRDDRRTAAGGFSSRQGPSGAGRDDRRGGFARRGPGAARPQFREREAPLDAEIKILPETKALGTVMRKLQQGFLAYKLKDLAYFFLDNPSSVLMKVSPRRSDDARREQVTFHQCKACGFTASDAASLEAHIVAAHIGDYYDVREVECEPPKGNFTCVAKCGLSGVLLGPPNIHGFNSTVREMIRTKYPSMSEAEYRSRIVMLREPEAIEEWRKGATKKTVFVPKGAGDDAPELAREQAEAEFRRTALPSMVDEPKTLMITADAAIKSPCAPLRRAAQDALEAERRNPFAMMFALRGAFHHRKMHFFRANDPRGQEFVTGAELREFDAAHAIPELAAVAKFIEENPCSSKAEIAKTPEEEKLLAWLVSTGHVVAFTNGVYSAVEKHPKYGPQWRKRSKPVKDAPAQPEGESAPAAAPETPENPVIPDSPDNPDNPEIPETPDIPENPANSEPPATPTAPDTQEPTEPEETAKDETAPQLA